ncbi:hypothetical protein DFH07DRAFT_50468 [Mycena maculata]|uniref:Uncharacterized protein n=1 Tax=Mycena maculata TaxID=230809 RepID=A0AAD7IHZ2_9AGAR|nr:hypothetical protein DFH07DRAFT_50468 [Mycena maculata]
MSYSPPIYPPPGGPLPTSFYSPPSSPPPPSVYPPPRGSPPSYLETRTTQMGTPDPRQGSSSGIQLTRDADFLIQSFLPETEPQYPVQASKLPLPYCTPQLMPAFDAPFARGYNPALESVDIPRDELLAFIDGLNLAMTASPPLRVVNLAGMVIGFVPYHWAMIAGTAIQVGAQVGMHVLSKTLTDRYLRAANLRLFKPRGLSVRICTAAAMQHLVMHTPIPAPPSKLTNIGRGVGSLLMGLPTPITSVLVHAVSNAPPKVNATYPDAYGRNMNTKFLATQRRVDALAGYALPLDFDMPKAAKAQGVMNTMSSWGVKFDSWKYGRKQIKAEERRFQLEQVQRGLAPPLPQSRGGLIGRGLELLGSGSDAGRPGGDPRYPATYDDRRLGGDRFTGAYDDGRFGRHGRREDGHRDRVRRKGGLVGGLMDLVSQTEAGSVLANRGNSRGGLVRGLVSGRGNDLGMLQLQVKNADFLEHWQSAKVMWLVIMPSEMDDRIDGIELAESRENEERVDERTWQAEMQQEKEDLEFEDEVERRAADQKYA